MEFEFPLWAWYTHEPPASAKEFERAQVELAARHCGRPVTLLLGVKADDAGDTEAQAAGGSQRDEAAITEIRTNTFVLSRHSPVFREMFDNKEPPEPGAGCLKLPGKDGRVMEFIVSLLSASQASFDSFKFEKSSIVEVIGVLKEYQMLVPLAKAVQFLKKKLRRLRGKGSLEQYFRSVFRYLRQIVQQRVDELEFLVLSEIRALYCSLGSCRCAGGSVYFVASVDSCANFDLRANQRATGFDQLAAVTQQKVLALWSP